MKGKRGSQCVIAVGAIALCAIVCTYLRPKYHGVAASGKPRFCFPRKVTYADALALGFQPLSESAVEGVEKFVFFVGYGRSGHSMIGSVMDAHPNIVIANQYFIFLECAEQLKAGSSIFHNKAKLFNAIYQNSYVSSKCGWRSESNTSKGYNLNVEGQWQGTFRQLRVIGDKSGEQTSKMLLDYDEGKKCLKQMADGLDMPVFAIHVVRNPYDIIATTILYRLSNEKNTKATDILHRKVKPTLNVQLFVIDKLFSRAHAVTVVSKEFTVLEIHTEDYIKDPRRCVLEICNTLELPCPHDYVEGCYQKAYRNVSRTRDLIEWDPVALREIRERMKEFPFFHGYTFEDDFREL